ncbi:hypothetical protein LY622_10685 [Halomonas sp. M5N1S17]|uniref:hypothetical protein n=1 Tax=Halomonas alkalisoli TaxID=2907158 RepID=UPI001F2A88C1|nr:hypothetical protein [Halomonas alkalisoli]MCE9663910.1 hypothetical protein [Halomonas alkalisoli]
MKTSQKLMIATGAGIGVAVVIAVFLWSRQPEHTSLQDGLGRAFNRPAQYIEVNLPPADGRYPGAVIVMPQPGQAFPLRRAYRPSQVPDFATSLTARLVGQAEAALASQFIGSASSAGDLAVDIALNDLRLFEVDLNEQFRNSLIEDEDVYRAEKRGSNPRVIVRTYEAVMSVSVRRTGSLSAEAWEKAQDGLIKAGGRIKDASTIAFEGDRATAIAYETVTVNYIATSLSGGRPSDVEIREAVAVNVAPRNLDISAFGLTGGMAGVRYALLGNSSYSSEEFGNLRVVEPSIQVAESVFRGAGARPLLSEPLPHILSESSMEEAVSRIVGAPTAHDAQLIVFYYAGHAVSGRGGQLYLVMQDYKGNPAEDLGEDLFLGLPRAQLDAPSSPLAGSNIHDLLDMVVAIQTEAPAEVRGLYPVSKLVKDLEAAGRPFVILIDACYEHEQMDHLRRNFNLTGTGDYYGPDISGGAREFKRFADAIRQFGVAPYLNSTNVVIFSATPGTIAVEVDDPRPTWEPHRKVAPLARRMYRRFESAVVESQPLSWGHFMQSIVDVKPIGEMRVHGTVSWSDYTAINEIPMLRDSASAEQEYAVDDAVRRH